ncbi:MAG: efflux RND transporter periplasmic adaptor subunit [Pyrinomonadaceae bacterium]|nr:efflux RND transporter periplasmic adaptor subunit [Pyrinomonadaceae bacterium]
MNKEKEEVESEVLTVETPSESEETADDLETVETARRSEVSNRKIAVASILGALLIGVVGFAAWRFLLKSDEGKPVPAPRNVSVNDSLPGSKSFTGEQKITLTDEQLQAADLKIVTVGETFDAAAIRETTTGVVRANEYRETPVISQVGGVVKSINADLGQYIRKGQTVAIIASEELAQIQSKYLSMKADLDEAEKRYKRALNLSEISEESRNELDKQTANLKAAEAKLAEAKSDYVRSKKLVEIGAISRRQLEIVTTALKVAEANVSESKNRFERARELLKINPARRNEIDQFLTKMRNQQADIASVRERLLVLGLSNRRVNALNSPRQISSSLPIVSPISGTITERIANQNEVVSANGKLAEITDLSVVWVIGQVYEKDLGKLRLGSGASVTSDAYPGELIRGQISYIDPNLDEKTRTAQVRIEIQNPNQKLKIGQYVNVAYARVGGASEKTAPLVQKASVQSIGDQKIVFEATDDPKTFILRPVRLGPESDNSYPVKEGLFVGDKVVSEGSFLLRAEYLKTNSSEL